MSTGKKIAIITPSAITAYGLKQLLTEYFGQLNCCLFLDVREFMQQQPDSYDLYFLLAEPVLMNYDFFLPRKAKTVILTVSEQPNEPFLTLPLYRDLSSTIDTLQQIFDRLVAPKEEDHQEELSSREIEVLKLIARGMINKEIAEELCISLNTVLTHRKNITSKLGIKTVSGLTFYAMMNGYAVE